MRKEGINLLLTSALILQGCVTVKAHADSPDTATPDAKTIYYDPTLTPPIITLPPPTPTEVIITPTPKVEKVYLANECVLPFTGATLDGLQFKSIITNNGEPVVEKDGTFHRHLGLDFKGGYEGIDIVNMCDGEIVFSGAVKKGSGLNLGNIVVVKYTYQEAGQAVNVYMRYAHMENVTKLKPGTKISKGEKIGEMGHSGGWSEKKTHLHIDLWREEAWRRIVVDRAGDDLSSQAGYYALGEVWGDNDFAKNLIDPKPWLTQRLK